MKRFLAATLLLCLCMSMAGCSALDYTKANGLYQDGQYAQALELYKSLGDFADSADMAEICAQKADYAAAESYFAAKDYVQALPLYEGLGMYMDSPLKAIECRYESGLGCIADRDYAQAVSWLAPLGNYEDSLNQTNLARWQWLSQTRRTLVIEEGAGTFWAISIEPGGEETLRILLEQKGFLLGLPYETAFTLTLTRNDPQADYTVRYQSVSDTTITETASGTVELGNFAAGGFLQIAEFQQSVTGAAGEETLSNDVTEAIMIRTVIADAQTQVMTYLPQLLEESGVDITITDLGL